MPNLTLEQKLAAVARVKAGEQQSLVARELGVSQSNLSEWVCGRGLGHRGGSRRARSQPTTPAAPPAARADDMLATATALRDDLMQCALEVEKALPAIQTVMALQATIARAKDLRRLADSLGQQLDQAQARLTREAMAVYSEGSLLGKG